MSSIKRIDKKIKKIDPSFKAIEDNGCIRLSGESSSWDDIVEAGKASVTKDHYGVLNDIKLKGFIDNSDNQNLPTDKSLDGTFCDCLVIGGGVIGTAILRELSMYELNSILVEKASDVAVGQTGRNGGVVHVGIDMKKHPIKASYCIRGNKMFDKLTSDLDVPFEHNGQVVIIKNSFEKILYPIMKSWARQLHIEGVKYVKRDELLKIEPCAPSWATGGVYMKTGGIVNPFKLTVAQAENAIDNGAKVYLDTKVLSMEVENGIIKSVLTNRGKIYPKVIINAAGIYADKIAEMAKDRTFTIHPRKGTDIILDKKVGYMVHTSFSKSPLTVVKEKDEKASKNPFKGIADFIKFKDSHVSKGLGTIHSVDGNMLIGPTAIETPEREDFTTDKESFDFIIEKQSLVSQGVKRSDIIAYFSGTRSATYEEDFVVRKGIYTKNIMEAAGIQSPGLTAAPAIAVDIVRWIRDYLKDVEVNDSYNPIHHFTKVLKDLNDDERNELIKKNPLYGEIVCRCEEVSKGEIIDCLNSSLKVYTLDAIKRRIRPGMGRCQGGFCSPLVLEIIKDEKGCDSKDVLKNNLGSNILFGSIKGDKNDL